MPSIPEPQTLEVFEEADFDEFNFMYRAVSEETVQANSLTLNFKLKSKRTSSEELNK